MAYQISRFRPLAALLLLALGLMACQLVGFEIRPKATPTATANLPATIALLVTANSQLAAQVSTLEARPTATAPESTPTVAPPPATPSPLPTVTPTVTPLPPTPISPQPVIILPTPTASPTGTPVPWQVTGVFFSPKLPNRLVALQTGATGRRLLTSNDYGQHWATLITGWPVEPGCINSFNLDYHNPELFFLATCQGIYHWTTVGWKQEQTKPVGAVTNLPEQPRLLWATEPFGPTDVPVIQAAAGETWAPASRYLEHSNGVARLMFDPIDPGRLFAVVWPDFPGSLLRRGANNGQWTTLPGPPASRPIDLNISIDGVSGALYVTTGAQLWRSPNPNSPDAGAVSWELVFDSPQPITLLGGSWPNRQWVLFANLNNVPHYSRDGGKNWELLPVPGSF